MQAGSSARGGDEHGVSNRLPHEFKAENYAALLETGARFFNFNMTTYPANCAVWELTIAEKCLFCAEPIIFGRAALKTAAFPIRVGK